MSGHPSYLDMTMKQWAQKEETARCLLTKCRCCGNYCLVNRKEGEKGRCRAGADIVIACADNHLGEEPPVSGHKGSGNIFFTFCVMGCVYCQNYTFSQLGQGKLMCINAVADLMINLQEKGCHNINLVTPTHFVPQIFFAIKKAAEKGLKIPIVYNTNSYDTQETLSLMENIVDIYLADMRYDDPEKGWKYSGVKEYPQRCRAAIKEMYRQVGALIMDEEDIAVKGLIIRHLVLPDSTAGSRGIFEFIARELSDRVPVSLMSQYFPTYLASEYPEINRRITSKEYEEALGFLEAFGLIEGWTQEI